MTGSEVRRLVACPTCGAVAGRLCRSIIARRAYGNTPTSRNHRARTLAALKTITKKEN